MFVDQLESWITRLGSIFARALEIICSSPIGFLFDLLNQFKFGWVFGGDEKFRNEIMIEKKITFHQNPIGSIWWGDWWIQSSIATWLSSFYISVPRTWGYLVLYFSHRDLYMLTWDSLATSFGHSISFSNWISLVNCVLVSYSFSFRDGLVPYENFGYP